MRAKPRMFIGELMVIPRRFAVGCILAACACTDDERVPVDTAQVYEDGCDDAREDGAASGEKDGSACHERALDSNYDLSIADIDEYCADAKNDSADPCFSSYEKGYFDCYFRAYDNHYQAAFAIAGCK